MQRRDLLGKATAVGAGALAVAAAPAGASAAAQAGKPIFDSSASSERF